MKNTLRSTLLAASVVLAFADLGQATSIGYLRDAPGGDGPFLSGAMLNGAGYINSWNGRAGALGFELSVTGPTTDFFSLITYCGDPTRNLSVGPVGGTGFPFNIIGMGDFYSDSGDIANIEKLWKIAFSDSLTSATKAAAFQFLLWEYIADSAVDFANGVARISDANVRSQAQTWASQVDTATARASLLVLDGRQYNRQSFFLEQPGTRTNETPEPGTYALLGAGLIAFAYLKRNR